MKHHLFLPTFLPVSFPDAMETFLEDMAKKGWFLKKVGYFLSFCQFEKGTPAPVRYRLEPVPDTVRTPSAEMVQFYEDFGWKYLTTFSHFFFIFVAENPDTPETIVTRWYRQKATNGCAEISAYLDWLPLLCWQSFWESPCIIQRFYWSVHVFLLLL